MSKVTLTIHDVTPEIAEKHIALLKAADGRSVERGSGQPAQSGKGKTKPPVDEVDELEETTDEDDGLGDLEADDGPTLADVTAACKANREKAKSLLKKFKIKSIHELEESDYPKFLKALK